MSRKRNRRPASAAPHCTARLRAQRPGAVRTFWLAVAALACVGTGAAPASASATGPSATGPSAAGPSASTSKSDVSRGVPIPAFYRPPAELPAQNGKLIRSERLRLGLSLPGLDGRPLPGTATRLMYKSTDSDGRPVAVTGAYVEPSAAWRGGGPRPLVAVASGTMGQGDQCAPSLALENPLVLNGQTVSVGYENMAVYRLLAKGVAVVVTDYKGLGTTDQLHTYVNRVDEGHAVLDAVRAARTVPGASVDRGSRVGLYGYSQGGGATAAAAELQRSYAPDVPLAGTYSGAPPADLTEVMDGIEGSALAGALGWSVNGFAQSYPEVRKVVDENINARGRAALKDLSTMCVGDAILRYGFTESSRWTRSGKSLGEIIAAEPAAQAVLDEQRIGDRKPAGAVRVATGVEDDIVPHEQARRLAADWCAEGGDVTYAAVKLPNLGDKLLTNHLAPLLTDQGNAISWLTDRLSGQAAASDCSELPHRS